MILKNLDEIVMPAGPASSTDTLQRRFVVDAETTVDDDTDPLDDKIGKRDLATCSELSEEIILKNLELRSAFFFPAVLKILTLVPDM